MCAILFLLKYPPYIVLDVAMIIMDVFMMVPLFAGYKSDLAIFLPFRYTDDLDNPAIIT